MSRVVVLMLAAVAVVMLSGCALVGRNAAPVEGGQKTTVGLLSFDSIGDGYPMIPLYSSFEQSK